MNKNLLVAGLGGVGGICAEMIAWAGVCKRTIVDWDIIDLSNINRQIAALHSAEKNRWPKKDGGKIKRHQPGY
ncbi:MAG: ThiF family adenylyltransferase [Ferruginibacter sp.]|nr:ThiF family adenylyltransferase [Ferruginibacter sp.]